MSIQMAQARPTTPCEIGADQLRGDYRLLGRLIERFELADDCYVRRELMELVVDLFEAHVAIRALVRKPSKELQRECEAVYELMEQVDGTDARSKLHLARGIELGRALRSCIASEELIGRGNAILCLPSCPESRALLNEYAALVDCAESLVRLH